MSSVDTAVSRPKTQCQWLPGFGAFTPPTITAALSCLVAILVCIPSLVPAYEFDSHAIAAGQWWRLFTGHLAHWNLDHAAWDGLMFFALGWLCETRWPRRFIACLAASALMISAALLCLQPELDIYRGLSGIDSALFTLAVGCLLNAAITERRLAWATMLGALLLGLLAKILYEYTTGATLFVHSAGAFEPIPLAHLVGAGVGLIVTFVGNLGRHAVGCRS